MSSSTARPAAELEGLSIVITGGGRGVGRACSIAGAAAGASVVVNDVNAEAARSTVAEIVDAGGRAVAHPADISDPVAASDIIARCVDEFGTIDGLVNNAALMSNGTVLEYDADEFRRLLDVNVLGLANIGAAAIKIMLGRGRGSVVNIVSGAHLGMEHMGLYGATKGAVASLTYTWALEARDGGVRVNAVSPWAAGRMTDDTDVYRAARGLESAATATAPDPSSNFPAIGFLLSDRSVPITGQIIRIQGSQLALMSHPSVTLPVLESEHWDVDAVAAAFDATLVARLSPLGVVAYSEPAASTFSGVVRVGADAVAR